MGGKSAYPTLSELGVTSTAQIDSYYITSLNRVDALRIVYDRPTGSFLTSSRTYKFPRVPEGATDETVLKTHPKLVAAIDELDELLKAKSRKVDIAESILNEIALLEEDIAMRTECVKALAKKIPIAE